MPKDDTWKMATGEGDGKPMIFRVRSNAPSFARSKKSFSQLLGISWPYKSPNKNGMPSEKVVGQMTQLEDLLVSAFEGAAQAFLTIVVTGNGVREWQWYARDRDTVMKLLNETLSEYKPFPIQIGFEDDPSWQAYSRFREIISGG
jgi:hypothetical protein